MIKENDINTIGVCFNEITKTVTIENESTGKKVSLSQKKHEKLFLEALFEAGVKPNEITQEDICLATTMIAEKYNIL